MTVDIEAIHLVGIAISAFLFYRSYLLLRQRQESILEFLFWSGFGTAIALLVVGHAVDALDIVNFFQDLFRDFGFDSGMNGIIIVSILAILMMLFHIYIETKSNQEEIYQLNQELALMQYRMDSDDVEEIQHSNEDDQ